VRGAEGDRHDASQGPHADPCEALLGRSHPPCSLQSSGPRDRPEPEAGEEARTRQQGEPGARSQIEHSGSAVAASVAAIPAETGKESPDRPRYAESRRATSSQVSPSEACGFESRPRHQELLTSAPEILTSALQMRSYSPTADSAHTGSHRLGAPADSRRGHPAPRRSRTGLVRKGEPSAAALGPVRQPCIRFHELHGLRTAVG
jgi:hypothetical protein